MDYSDYTGVPCERVKRAEGFYQLWRHQSTGNPKDTFDFAAAFAARETSIDRRPQSNRKSPAGHDPGRHESE